MYIHTYKHTYIYIHTYTYIYIHKYIYIHDTHTWHTHKGHNIHTKHKKKERQRVRENGVGGGKGGGRERSHQLQQTLTWLCLKSRTTTPPLTKKSSSQKSEPLYICCVNFTIWSIFLKFVSIYIYICIFYHPVGVAARRRRGAGAQLRRRQLSGLRCAWVSNVSKETHK
jgi:hypothetical protein